MKKLSLILILLSSTAGLWAHAEPIDNSFARDMEYFQNNPEATLTSEEIAQARGIHFVTVAGFLNLGLNDYFLGFKKTLRDLGVKVTRIYPSSLNPVVNNGPLLAQALEQIYENKYNEGDGEENDGVVRPLAVLGHSKGAAELTYTMLDHPKLMTSGKIRLAVAFEGVLSANGLFENLPGVNLAARLSPFRVARSLTAQKVKTLIPDKVRELQISDPVAYSLVSSKMTYVIADKSVDDMGPMTLTAKIIQGRDKTKSDGAVATRGQMVNGFGQVIGYVDANHLELVSSIGSTAVSLRAFTLATVRNGLRKINGDTKEFAQLTKKVTSEFYGQISCQDVYRSLF